MVPQITSWDDLEFVTEEVDSESNTFQYTSFSFLDNDKTFHYGEISTPKKDLSLDQVKEALQRVPDETIFPAWPPAGPTLRKAPETLPADIYIKSSSLELYSFAKKRGFEKQLFNSLVAEAEVLEELSQHPHPNLIRYHGCRVTRGYLTGLVLDKHPCDLEAYIRDGCKPIDKARFLAALESVIQHIHGLGWAHNDLTPTNILVSEAGEPVLIDFGGCQKFGTDLKYIRGTKGWIEGEIEDYCTSEAKHDIFALRKIRAWLEDPTSRAA